MVEYNPITKEAKKRDAILISLTGGVIGIIGTIAEGSIIFSSNADLNSAVWMGGATLTGFALAIGGAIGYLRLRKESKNSSENEAKKQDMS